LLAIVVLTDLSGFSIPYHQYYDKEQHLIVLAALVGGEQRTAVLLGQVGNGLNKCDSSHKNFKNKILGN
jgi:hypothetical protein